MASTYSDRLRIELIGTGEQSGTWGNTTNTNLGTLIEEAIAGVVTISMSDANYTLTTANGATDESRQAVLQMTGSLSTTRDVICPAEEKIYIIKNGTTGGQSIVLKTSGGTGVTIPNGKTMLVYCDGTNVVTGNDALTSIAVAGNATVTGTLTVDGATSLDDTVVINESGADKDFRVEGDTDVNLLFTDASADAVGIGTNTPGAKLNVVANTSGDAVRITQTGAGNALVVEDSANPDSTPFVVTADGNVGIATSSPTALLDVNGSVAITGTGRRITGDFSNATVSSRLAFQTSTANSATSMFVIPNGTGTTGSISVSNSSSPDNSAITQLAVTSTESVLRAGIVGSGSYLPLNFYTGGSERVRIDASGNVGIGTSSPQTQLDITKAVAGGAGLTAQVNNTDTGATSSSYLQVKQGSVNTAIYSYGNSGSYIGSISNNFAAFITNNTERMRIDSSGNVGIGTSSPGSFGLFAIDRGTSASAMAYFKNNATNGAWTAYDYNGTVYGYIGSGSNLVTGAATSDFVFRSTANMIFGVGTTERMRIDSSGNVGIGTASAGFGDLTILRQATSSTNSTLSLVSGSSGYGRLFFGDAQNSAAEYDGFIQYDQSNRLMQFGTAQAERARIDANGNFLIGTTTAFPGVSGLGGNVSGFMSESGNTLFLSRVDSNPTLYINRGGTDGIIVILNKDAANVGNISVTSTGATFNSTSDYRLKEDIKPMKNALASISSLRPVTYKWKIDGSEGEGFVAHELQAVKPYAVSGEKDAVNDRGEPIYQGIDQSKLVATLVAAIQEQQALIEDLKARVAQLENA